MILEIIAILIVIALAGVGLSMALDWEPIEEWADVLLRSATTWTTGAVNAVLATIGVHWAVLLGVLPFLPFYWQLPLALLIAVVTTAPTIIGRLTKQPKMQAKIKGRRDGSV